MERQSELKLAWLLEIYSRLSQGAVLKKIGISAGFSCHAPEHPAGHGGLALFFCRAALGTGRDL